MTIQRILTALFTISITAACISCSSDDIIFVDDKPCDLDELKDKSTAPGDDFYRYCNGAWQDATIIPEGKTRASFLSTIQSVEAENMLREQTKNPTIPLLRSLKDDYDRRSETCQSDYAVIRSYMSEIDSKATLHDLMQHAGKLMRQNMPTFVAPFFYVQYKRVKIVFDYDSRLDISLTADDICQLGFSKGEAEAMLQNAIPLSSGLRRVMGGTLSMRESLTKPVSDDTYSLAVKHLASRATDVDDNVSTMLNGMGLSRDMLYYIVDYELTIYDYLNKLTDKDLARAKDYLKLVVAQYMLRYTDYFKGISYEMELSNNNYVAPALSKLFAETHHTAQSKQYIETMCENIRASLINRIGRLDWMVDNTKNAATEKVADMQFYCCYPENWTRELVEPTVTSKSYMQDLLELGQQFAGHYISVCGSSDRNAMWDVMLLQMPMYVINACYIPSTNLILITSAISCAPLVDNTKSDAYNYGTIATVIGHEMTHGLDSSGSLYDKDGYFSVWWTMDDKLKFIERQQQLITIYNNLVVVPGIFQNGEKTLGENIADLGGTLAAYDSFVALRQRQGCKGEQLDEQKKLFYESYASVWRDKRTMQGYMDQQKVDVHSNGICRINGVVCNHPDWYQLYDVKPDNRLYLAPERRVSIW